LDLKENEEFTVTDKNKGATKAAQQRKPDEEEDVHDFDPPEAQG